MPVRRVPGGYQWGSRGKVYKTRAEAERQARAAYASGYRESDRKKEGGKAEPFWKKDNPKKESKPLTAAQKARARAAAKKAGRRYPNLVDNARAARSRD